METVVINKGFTSITVSDIEDGIFTIQINTSNGGQFKKSQQEIVVDIKNNFIATGNLPNILLALKERWSKNE